MSSHKIVKERKKKKKTLHLWTVMFFSSTILGTEVTVSWCLSNFHLLWRSLPLNNLQIISSITILVLNRTVTAHHKKHDTLVGLFFIEPLESIDDGGCLGKVIMHDTGASSVEYFRQHEIQLHNPAYSSYVSDLRDSFSVYAQNGCKCTTHTPGHRGREDIPCVWIIIIIIVICKLFYHNCGEAFRQTNDLLCTFVFMCGIYS